MSSQIPSSIELSSRKISSEEQSEHQAKMLALQEEQKKKVKERDQKKGLLIVNTGAGKGKSTAGFGTAFRAVGQDLKVAIVQFIKGSWKTGEVLILSRMPEVDYACFGEGFTWDTQDKSRDIALAESGLEHVSRLIKATKADNSGPLYDLILLDELNVLLELNYLDTTKVCELLASRDSSQHIICTGRGAPPQLLEIADTVTEMQPIRHAFDHGIKAQRGIEF